MKFRNREMKISSWQGIRVVFAALFITIFGLAGISHAARRRSKKHLRLLKRQSKRLLQRQKATMTKKCWRSSVPAQKS